VAASALWVAMRIGGHGFDQLDMRIYRMGATALWQGTGLYAAIDPGTGLPFTYPPFAALLMLPAVLLPAGMAGLGMGVASCVALARLCHVSVTRIGGIPRLGYAASFWIVLGVAFVSEPVLSTLSFGQVNLILVWLVVEDLTRGRGQWLGVGTGIAAAVKLVPGVFLVYLWLAGLRRAALRGVLTFAVAGVVTAALFWSDSRTFWSGMFADAGHVGGIPYQANQSALGVVARALGTETPALWMYLPSVVALGVSLALATWFARHGDRNRGLILTAVGGLLASPISWSHHWVWWVPLACLLLADVAAGRPGARALLAATVLVFTTRLIWWPPSADDAALSYNHLQQALTAAYFVLGVAILAWHAHMAWSQRGRSQDHRQFVAGHRNNIVDLIEQPSRTPGSPIGR
jgi:alpha-1,2-mannosyltransferase